MSSEYSAIKRVPVGARAYHAEGKEQSSLSAAAARLAVCDFSLVTHNENQSWDFAEANREII